MLTFVERWIKRVCLETYRKEVERINISFAVLHAEECETCKKHSEHMDDRDTAENSAGVSGANTIQTT